MSLVAESNPATKVMSGLVMGWDFRYFKVEFAALIHLKNR